MAKDNCPLASMGMGFRPPTNTRIHGHSSPLHKMTPYFHVAHVQPPVYFRSSPHLLTIPHTMETLCE